MLGVLVFETLGPASASLGLWMGLTGGLAGGRGLDQALVTVANRDQVESATSVRLILHVVENRIVKSLPPLPGFEGASHSTGILVSSPRHARQSLV